MSDDMIKLLAKNGGVIQISFGSDFLSQTYRESQATTRKNIAEYQNSHNMASRTPEARAFAKQYRKEHPVPHADVKDVVAHIDHVVKLVGIDHVGLGSDFDGVGDSLPMGLEDVSKYPNLIYELLRAGYSDKDIKKICGENLLKVWSQVEVVAKDLQAKK
jgi:membrane dipeptidase